MFQQNVGNKNLQGVQGHRLRAHTSWSRGLGGETAVPAIRPNKGELMFLFLLKQNG